MEFRKMSLSRSWIQEQQFVLQRIVAVLVLFSCAVAAVTGNTGNYKRIFIIGDSYVDNGNRDPSNTTYTAIGRVNQPWTPPFGRTFPGSPAGRFTDGKMLSDFLADYMGLKPRPYRVLSVPSLSTNVADGINFAVGGAGVFDNLGFTKTGDQIAQLNAVLESGLYKNNSSSTSLIFYAVSGNDYAAFQRSNSNLLAIIPFIAKVVNQITQDLLALYKLGFRSFVVSKLAPVGCNPATTFSNGFAACNVLFNFLATSHNAGLYTQVSASLPADAKVIFLDNQLAFSSVLDNFANPGRLKPCCTGLQNGKLCGDLDSANNPQYTLCSPSSQSQYFFWDEFHPTEASWGNIFNLFKQDPPLYTNGKSLPQFLGLP